MKTNKILWLSLLSIALGLFLIGLNTGNYVFNISTVIICIIVYKYGYKDLFKDYDEKQRKKRETAEKIYTALHEGKKKDGN